LTRENLDDLTDEELEVLEHAGIIEKRKGDEKPKLKKEVKTK